MPLLAIIDDDVKLVALLTDYLARYGFSVVSASCAPDGKKLLTRHDPSLLILDVMLPGQDGLSFCKELRATSSLPVLLLTARGEVMDRIVGLELGADDYLPKPFEPRELVARIQAILRRGKSEAGRVLRFEGFEIDRAAHTVRLDGALLELSTMEFDILILLATHPGEALDRDRIMNELKGADWMAFDRSIDVAVSRLRQKLGDDPKRPRFLKTVWGKGYAFIAKETSDGA